MCRHFAQTSVNKRKRERKCTDGKFAFFRIFEKNTALYGDSVVFWQLNKAGINVHGNGLELNIVERAVRASGFKLRKSNSELYF